MRIQIKARFTDSILFEGEFESTRHAVETAIKSGADLYGANLCGANLCGADLRGANLYDADLRDADLCDADLCDADLCDADLCGADLCGADLRGADLYDANLRGADLCGANLRGADLRDADLYDADLRDADLCDADNNTVDKIVSVSQMSGIDGSGRRIAIVFGEKDTWVVASCFFGTVKEFCAKAKLENKLIYVKVVKTFCDMKRKQINEQQLWGDKKGCNKVDRQFARKVRSIYQFLTSSVCNSPTRIKGTLMSNEKIDAFIRFANSQGIKINLIPAKKCHSCGVAFIPPKPSKTNQHLQTNVCRNCYCKSLQAIDDEFEKTKELSDV